MRRICPVCGIKFKDNPMRRLGRSIICPNKKCYTLIAKCVNKDDEEVEDYEYKDVKKST